MLSRQQTKYPKRPRNPRFITERVDIKMTGINQNNEFTWLIGIVVIFFLPFLLIVLAALINSFFRELKYINSEIERTTGSERKYWLRKRRRLWLSLFFFSKYR